MPVKIMIDPGHGGVDNGASFQDRKEKDEVLQLALALGDILENQGYEVAYTRTDDVYDSPVEKARIGNASGADFFISLHRNSSATPNEYNGVQTLVYEDSGIKADMARNINSQLEQLGFRNINVQERKNLAVLRRTSMPALLVEVGFINSDKDNELWDNNFNEIAQAIADGIDESIQSTEMATGMVNSYYGYEIKQPVFARTASGGQAVRGDDADDILEDLLDDIVDRNEKTDKDDRYQILVGIFRSFGSASYKMNELENAGYDASIYSDDGLFQVRVGIYDTIEEALVVQKSLRDRGYDTLIVEFDD